MITLTPGTSRFCFGCGVVLDVAMRERVDLCRRCRDRFGAGALYMLKDNRGGRHGPFAHERILEQLHKNFFSGEDFVAESGRPFQPLHLHPDFAAWFLPGDSRFEGIVSSAVGRRKRFRGKKRRVVGEKAILLSLIAFFAVAPFVAVKGGWTVLPQPWLDWLYTHVAIPAGEVIDRIRQGDSQQAVVSGRRASEVLPGQELVKRLKHAWPEQDGDARELAAMGWEQLARFTLAGAREAREPLERAVALEPGRPGALGGLAVVYRSLGREDQSLLEDSQVLLERAQLMKGEDGVTWRAVAATTLLSGGYHGAATYAETCLEKSPEDRLCAWIRVEALRGQGNYEEALALLEAQGDRFPEHSRMNFARGQMALEAEQYATAEHFLLAHLTEEPEEGEAHALLGRLYRETGQLEQAMAKSRDALAFDSQLLDAKLLTALLLYQVEGDFEQAGVLLDSLVATEPGDPEFGSQVYVHASHVHRSLGDLDAAVELADRALALRSGWAPAHLAKAMALEEHGNRYEAGRVLHQADLSNLSSRDGARYHFWSAQFYMRQDRHRDAEQELEHAKDLDPGWGQIQLGLVSLDLQVGRTEQILTDLSASFRLDLEQELSRDRLVDTYVSRLDPVEIYSRLEERYVNDPLISSDLPRFQGLVLALGCMETSSCESAMDALVVALQANRQDAAAMATLGRLLLHADRPEEAVSWLELALDTEGSAAVIHGLEGAALAELGRVDSAEEALDQAYLYSPGLGAAHRHHAQIMYEKGRYREAEIHVRAALDADPYDNQTRALILALGERPE